MAKKTKVKITSKKKSTPYIPEGPRMFSDEPAAQALAVARNISDLKNLGPESEKAFTRAGIKTAQQFIKMGWKNAMKKLVQYDHKNAHSIFAYALIGALKNTAWNAIPESDKLEARTFVKSLREKGKLK